MSFTLSGPARRDFRVAVAARSLSLFGDLVTIVTLTLLLQSRGEPPWTLAALFVAGLLPIVLLSPITGRLVDTLDSRWLLAVAGFGAAGAGVAVALAPSTPWLIGLVTLTGSLTGVLNSTWSALIPVIVGREQVAQASAVSQTTFAAAMLGAPAAAGLLTGWAGYRVPLLIDAATFALVAVAGLTLATRRRPERTDEPVRAREGWAVLRGDGVLRSAVTLLAAFVVLANCVNIVDVYLIRGTLGLPSYWYGLFGAMWGGGAVLSGLLARRYPAARAQARLLAVGCGLVILAIGSLALARNAAWLVPIAVIGGIGNGWSNAGANALFMLRSPDGARGRVSAAINAIVSAAELTAYGLAALLAGLLPVRAVLLVVGVGGLLVVLWRGVPLLRAVAHNGMQAPRRPRRPRRSTADADHGHGGTHSGRPVLTPDDGAAQRVLLSSAGITVS